MRVKWDCIYGWTKKATQLPPIWCSPMYKEKACYSGNKRRSWYFVRGLAFCSEGGSQIYKKSASIKLRPPISATKILWPPSPIHLTPKQAKIVLLTIIKRACWSHRTASSFAGVLHDRVFLWTTWFPGSSAGEKKKSRFRSVVGGVWN